MEPAVAMRTAHDKVDALLSPRNVAIVGATDRPGSWSERTWETLRRCGFPGAVYPVNPRRSEIWGVRCYESLSTLPEVPDHIAVLVPPRAVAGVLREAAQLGARSATIFTAGIGDANDPSGGALGETVARLIQETGLAVSGPNCMGNFCAKSRTVTLNDAHGLEVAPGPVAMVGQSGGVMLFTARALQERCLAPGYIVTSGNELGLTTAEYLSYFASDPDVKVIVSYLEGIRDFDRFRAACMNVRAAGKRVVVLKLGRSQAGREAALAHTGALAGSFEAFKAVVGELGVICVDTPDDIVETVELLVHAPGLRGRRLAALTLSGAFRGMLLDATEQSELRFAELTDASEKRLRELIGTSTRVGNPVDGGYSILTSEETYLACIETLEADPNVDLVLVQEELPRSGSPQRPVRYMTAANEFAATRAKKPIAYVSIVSYGQNEFSRELRRKLPALTILQEASRALRAVEKVVRCLELEQLASFPDEPQPCPAVDAIKGRIRSRAQARPTLLDEAKSKEILASYGIPMLPEELVACDLAAVEQAAARIEGPIVLKAVGPRLAHKSEVGAVALNLRTPAERAQAYERIVRSVEHHGLGPVEAILVAPYVTGGLEVALGLHRDPELGMVAMVGMGGVLLELVGDIAFAAPPITEAKANDMIARTRLARLLEGYRGTGPFDRAALVRALIALGRLAADLGGLIDSVDVNPFLVGPRGGRSAALDALIVAAPVGGASPWDRTPIER
jgi:acyl-CoA synthetase (NDP forming)